MCWFVKATSKATQEKTEKYIQHKQHWVEGLNNLRGGKNANKINLSDLSERNLTLI